MLKSKKRRLSNEGIKSMGRKCGTKMHGGKFGTGK